MITLCEYTGTDIKDVQSLNRVLFRGKNCFYWQEKMFLQTTDAANEEIKSFCNNNKEIDLLILFNPSTFLKIEPEGIKGIFSQLKESNEYRKKQGINKELILSLKGRPFLAMNKKSYENLKPDLAHLNPFSTFEDADIKIMAMEIPYKTLDIRKNFFDIENLILHFQAEELLRNGVIIEDFNHFYLEGIIPIGEGTRIATGVVIKGNSKIGKNTTLYPQVYIENSVIGDNCIVFPGCIINTSTLENNVQIGPYTHLRMEALVKEGAKMGNFVEMKKSTLGKGSKAMHLSYIGDAEIGEKVNIGAGTITCNYDGINKNKTIIEDHVFIGSGTELVAPITIKKNSYVAAGSTITEEVPADSLGVARQRQRNILNWVKRKRKKD